MILDRRRRGRDGADARHAVAAGRRPRAAHEGRRASSATKIRARERERRRQRERDVALRQSPKAYMKQHRRQSRPRPLARHDEAREKLSMAGYRSPSADGHLPLLPPGRADHRSAFRGVLYLRRPASSDYPLVVERRHLRRARPIVGFKLPEIFLSNTIQKRQLSIRRAWPDALDLLLICVESGMSIEHAFRRVSDGDRHASLAACRGTGADDGGALLSAGPRAGLRKSRQAAPASTASRP